MIDRFTSAGLEEVARRVVPGGRLVEHWPLTGGISAAMVGLEIEDSNGRRWQVVVRQHRHGDSTQQRRSTAAEFRLLRHLAQSYVPAPVAITLDESGEVLPEPYMVLALVTGEAEYAPASLDDYVRQAAGTLAAIHQLDSSGLDFLPLQANSCPELQRGSDEKLAGNLDDRRIRRALGSYARPPNGNAAVVLHGDYWPGNLIWHDGQLAAVVDWEDAKLGEPLLDLAIARLDLAWIFNLEAMERFTVHYRQLMTLDYESLPYWDLCAALRLARLVGDDLAGWASFFSPYGRNDIDQDQVRIIFNHFVTGAIGKAADSR